MTPGKSKAQTQDRDSNEAHRAACDRARELGFAEALLCAAAKDLEWKRAVEREFSRKGPFQKLFRGCSKPSAVWSNGLLRTQTVVGIESDPAVFGLLGRLNPRVAELQRDSESPAPEDLSEFDPIVKVLAIRCLMPSETEMETAALEEASDYLAAQRSDCEELPVEAASSILPEPDKADERDSAAHPEAPDYSQEVKQLRKHVAKLESDLRSRTREVSRKDKRLSELRAEVAELKTDVASFDTRLAQIRAERDELRRQVNRLDSQVTSSKQGQRTIEARREDEARRQQQTVTDLRDRLSSSLALSAALEKRVRSLEHELESEKQQRTEIEETLDIFGIDQLASSSERLQATLDMLVRLQSGFESYNARRSAKERERIDRDVTAQAERQAAEDARKREAEAARAWEARERERIEEMEREIFPDGQIDHIIIDGHNLLHRTFRPEEESRTRPWLERIVAEMALRLEHRGWDSCIHLVFDTQHASNRYTAGHGVQVYFENNGRGGGADARIAALLREGNPHAHYMVVSTDRRHVWTDAMDFIVSEGTEVELVQVELLVGYLQALGDLETTAA